MAGRTAQDPTRRRPRQAARARRRRSVRVAAPRPMLWTALCLALLLGGCTYRGTVPVELEPVPLWRPADPIEGAIELCLPPALRMAHWRYGDRFYVVHLGRKVALNVERLAKHAIRDVVVSFTEDCGVATRRPWLLAEITAAERRIGGRGPDETRVTIALSLSSDEGETIWQEQAEGVVPPGAHGLAFPHTRAARDFGRAASLALAEVFDRLRRSDTVRSSLAAQPL